MSTYPTPIDMSSHPDLRRLAKEVKKTGRSYVLRESNQDIAVLTPVKRHTSQQKAIEETLSLAGSWKELDFDEMIAQLDRLRHESKPTPPLELDL